MAGCSWDDLHIYVHKDTMNIVDLKDKTLPDCRRSTLPRIDCCRYFS